MQLPAHTFGQILSEGDILLGKGELERVPGVVVGTFRLHEHGRFCLFCAVSCYQGTGLHTRVLDGLCQRTLDEGIDGNACLCRQVGDVAMRIGSNSDVESTGKTFLRFPSVVTAECEIILSLRGRTL